MVGQMLKKWQKHMTKKNTSFFTKKKQSSVAGVQAMKGALFRENITVETIFDLYIFQLDRNFHIISFTYTKDAFFRGYFKSMLTAVCQL